MEVAFGGMNLRWTTQALAPFGFTTSQLQLVTPPQA